MNKNTKGSNRPVGRPEKGFPKPINATAEQVAKMTFQLPVKEK